MKNKNVLNYENMEHILVKKYKWTLQSETLRSEFIKKVDFDFVKKIIKIEGYDVYDPCDQKNLNLMDWSNKDLINETLIFSTYDGCGVLLYTYEISGIELLEGNISSFDYSSSEVSTIQIQIRFKHLKKIYGENDCCKSVPVCEKDSKYCCEANSSTKEPYKKKFQWKMRIQNCKCFYEVSLDNRPSVKMEEVEVNLFDLKYFFPTKAEWQPFKFKINYEFDINLIHSLLMASKNLNIELRLFDLNGEILETWLLQQCVLNSILPGNSDNLYNICEVSINYSNVSYVPKTIG